MPAAAVAQALSAGQDRQKAEPGGDARPVRASPFPSGQKRWEYITWKLHWLCVDVTPAALVASVSGA